MHDNVRDCLTELLLFNDKRTTSFQVADEVGGKKHNATLEDLQELNLSDLYNLCDLLGMSDLYLESTKENAE